MRSLILRSFSITAIALLFIQDAGAQRGRGYYRHYGYGPYRGQRVVHIGGPRVVIPYGGISFHYSNGYYYRPYSNYFRVVAPPIGIHINILPRGYRRVYVRLSDIFAPKEIPGKKSHCLIEFYDGCTMIVKGNYDDICIQINDLEKDEEDDLTL